MEITTLYVKNLTDKLTKQGILKRTLYKPILSFCLIRRNNRNSIEK